MTDIPDKVDNAAEAVPEPVVTPEPEHHEPEPKHDEEPEFVGKIINAIDHLAESLTKGNPGVEPVVEAVPEPVHETPVKTPWTHRGMFGKRE